MTASCAYKHYAAENKLNLMKNFSKVILYILRTGKGFFPSGNITSYPRILVVLLSEGGAADMIQLNPLQLDFHTDDIK